MASPVTSPSRPPRWATAAPARRISRLSTICQLGGETFSRSLARPSPGLNECFYNFIFTAGYDSNGWHGHDLDFLLNTYFPVGGTLAADTSGYLYGTTSECTDNNGTQYGTVWQLSP